LVEELTVGRFVGELVGGELGGRELVGGELGGRRSLCRIQRNFCFRGTLLFGNA
jgi:hypothetical protein